MMRFENTEMAVLLWVVLLVWGLLVFAQSKRLKRMARFAQPHLWPETLLGVSPLVRRSKMFFLISALLLMALSLMRPQVGFSWREIERKGLDIIIALDVSNSMLAEDIRPNRLERAKMEIQDLIRNLHSDRLGLIIFSGKPFLKCPLTLDYGGFLIQLDDVDVMSIPSGGTNIAKAIMEAERAYSESGSEGEQKILILLSDGEDHSGDLDRALENAAREGIKIFTLGLGTEEGELIPLKGITGEKGFLRDREGNIVVTKLDAFTLKKIADVTGGAYLQAGETLFGLETIYEEHLSSMEKQKFETRMERNYHDRFQIPLVLAFLLLLIEPFLGYKKDR